MTWYADEIILRARPAALQAVATSHLAPFAYHLRSLAGHHWYRQENEHGLPEGGLIVIRPVCGSSSHGFDWHEIETLDWATLPYRATAQSLLDSKVAHLLSEYLDEESMPPLQLRMAVATLAERLGQPICYYGCGMFGGSIDYQYSLVYAPEESLTTSDIQSGGPGTEDDALRAGLAKIGLVLPTGYFAPHTRGFPWQAHKLL